MTNRTTPMSRSAAHDGTDGAGDADAERRGADGAAHASEYRSPNHAGAPRPGRDACDDARAAGRICPSRAGCPVSVRPHRTAGAHASRTRDERAGAGHGGTGDLSRRRLRGIASTTGYAAPVRGRRFQPGPPGTVRAAGGHAGLVRSGGNGAGTAVAGAGQSQERARRRRRPGRL